MNCLVFFKRVAFFMALVLCSKNVFSEIPLEVKGGKGYFANLMFYLDPDLNIDERLSYNPDFYGKIKHGTGTWFNVSYTTNTGYKIGLNFVNSHVSEYYNDQLGLYWDKVNYLVYDLYGLNFAKGIRIKKHAISPGFGLTYRKVKESYCAYEVMFTEDDPNWVGEDDILYSFPAVVNRSFADLGLELLLDYQFYLSDCVSVGVRLSTNIPFNLGVETVLVSPFISIDLGAVKQAIKIP